MFNFNELKRIHLELTSICNAACPVCCRNIHGGKTLSNLVKQEMSIDLFKSLFTSDVLTQINHMLFCGNYGDPIMCKDLLKIIEYCKNKVEIEIHTNGSLQKTNFWKDLPKILNDRSFVTFSIDGLEDTNHIYRRKTNWDKIIKNAKTFINAGGTAKWQFLVFEHNKHQIEDAKKLSKEIGFKKIVFKDPRGFKNNQIKVLNDKGKYDYTIIQKDKKPDYIDTFDNTDFWVKPRSKLTLNYEKINCNAIKAKEVFIDASGNVHPCCWLGMSSQNSIESGAEGPSQYYDMSKFYNKNISIKEALSGNSYFKNIQETWNEDFKGTRIKTCLTMCGKNDQRQRRLDI